MMRVIALSLCLALLPTFASTSAQQTAPFVPGDLVSSWTLVSVERGVASGKPERSQNARGLLIIDSAGHVYEFFTNASRQLPEAAQVDPLRTFNSYGGFWGNYKVDTAQKRLVFTAESSISPNMMGREFSRTFEYGNNRLTLTSMDEAHTQGGTRWVWERVPTVEGFSPLYRNVVGFWQHVVERRVNLTTNTTTSESKRAPSVIVYTPGGFVGVHFPPLNRKPFAGAEPTAEEARAAIQGYVGYFGALTVYPNPPQVFHNVLAGLSPTSGTVLKRFAEITGDDLLVRFPPNTNQQGQLGTTLVSLKRLSGADQMLPPQR